MATFSEYLPLLIELEGGWSDHPNDTPTNMGITLATYRDYMSKNFGIFATKTELRNMTRETANKIYKLNYWNKIQGDYIVSQKLANTVMDMAVNSGVSRSVKMLQQSLNTQGHNLVEDGVLGMLTIGATNSNSNDEFELIKAFNDLREKHYRDLSKKNPSKKVFLKGWLNRLKRFRQQTPIQDLLEPRNLFNAFIPIVLIGTVIYFIR